MLLTVKFTALRKQFRKETDRTGAQRQVEKDSTNISPEAGSN
jgi:hypothetical protein